MRILSLISPTGFQEIEYLTPKQVLESHGHTVITASTVKNPVGHLGHTFTADLLLDEVHPSDYDAVFFVGGPGSHFYFDYKPALELAKDFYNSGKLTCAICAGPSILANAGLLKGVTATSFPSHEQNLRTHGAKFTGNPVEQDGLIITANGPAAAEAFGEKIHQALS